MGDFLDRADKLFAALEIVEADVELDRRGAGDDVGRAVAGADVGDLEVGRLEAVVAVVEVQR